MSTLRYIQYMRRSSDEKSKKQKQSIVGQKLALSDLIQRDGLLVVGRLEESRTAKEPGRPVFNEMISTIKKGQADAIVCWHLDRLTRNEIDSGTLRWLLRQGVIKEIRTPHRIYRPEDSLLITAVESALGEQFIVDHIHKVNRNMKLKCLNGGVPFYAPEGYLNDPLKKTVEVDPDRFQLICKVFQLVLSQSYSVPEIHTIMHRQWGYHKKLKANSTSTDLSLSSLYYLLSNPFYAGYFHWQGEVYIHNIPRAVTKEEFDRVQTILRPHSHNITKHHTFAYTSLLTCACCGRQITAEVSKGYRYYHCNNKLGICTKKSMREEAIDGQIDELLGSITVYPEFESLAFTILSEFRAEEEAARQATAKSQQSALFDVKRQKDALLGLYLQGHLETDEYAHKKQELSEREVSLKLNEEPGNSDLLRAHETIENVAHFATHARSIFQQGDPHLKRFIARHLATRYTFNNGELEIELNPLFVPVRSDFKKLEKDLKKIEPPKTADLNLLRKFFSSYLPVWYPRLEEYRNFILREQLYLPSLKVVLENRRVKREEQLRLW